MATSEELCRDFVVRWSQGSVVDAELNAEFVSDMAALLDVMRDEGYRAGVEAAAKVVRAEWQTFLQRGSESHLVSLHKVMMHVRALATKEPADGT